MSYKILVKDAFWQISGRILSAIGGFIVVKMMTPYLGTLRFGDYSTILKYFAIWSAFADFGIYVIALKHLGEIRNNHKELELTYGKYIWSRYFIIVIVYSLALAVSYTIQSYTANPYIARGLPIGMLFSASFMVAGIQQIPLQLFWKMQKLTVALTLSRISQIIVLFIVIFYLYPRMVFDGSSQSITAFVFILLSVLISGIMQNIYVHHESQKLLKLKFVFDRKFTRKTITDNWKYGFAYYISSFHTLLVLIFLSIFFPTVKDYDYVGIWSLALTLIEILLIVPSALGNSFIHKIADYKPEQKRKSYGSLFIFIAWIGLVFLINFWIFSGSIINFVGGKDFLSKNGVMGSEVILPYLAIVLALSFIKQIFNYYFVSFGKHNELLKINLFGLVLGGCIGIPFILKYNILGGIITQLLLEVLYVSGSIFIAWKNKILPEVNKKYLGIILGIMTGLFVMAVMFVKYDIYNIGIFLGLAIVLNIVILAVSYKPIKAVMKEI